MRPHLHLICNSPLTWLQTLEGRYMAPFTASVPAPRTRPAQCPLSCQMNIWINQLKRKEGWKLMTEHLWIVNVLLNPPNLFHWFQEQRFRTIMPWVLSTFNYGFLYTRHYSKYFLWINKLLYKYFKLDIVVIISQLTDEETKAQRN